MSFLIDTNVISEMSKPAPNKAVENWIITIPESGLFLSVVTIGELVYGICKVTDKIRKKKLSAWLDKVMNEGFGGRILAIDTEVMCTWGEMYAKLPRTIPIQDTLIAATAITNNLTLVTRNIRDFNDITGLTTINPWDL